MSSLGSVGPPLVVALVLLVAFRCTVSWLCRLEHLRGILVASLRAVARLAAVAAVLAAVVRPCH